MEVRKKGVVKFIMFNLCSRESELRILEAAGLAKLNRQLIRIKELNWIGIVEINNNSFTYEEISGENWILVDLVKAKVFRTKEDFETAYKDSF